MIAIRRRTFIIKVLFFIVSLLSFSRLEDDTRTILIGNLNFRDNTKTTLKLMKVVLFY